MGGKFKSEEQRPDYLVSFFLFFQSHQAEDPLLQALKNLTDNQVSSFLKSYTQAIQTLISY